MDQNESSFRCEARSMEHRAKNGSVNFPFLHFYPIFAEASAFPSPRRNAELNTCCCLFRAERQKDLYYPETSSVYYIAGFLRFRAGTERYHPPEGPEGCGSIRHDQYLPQ